MFRWLDGLFRARGMSEHDFEQARERVLRSAPIPVFWLFGKTGSGKSSIVRYLTGADAAEVGNGFRPQTRSSRRFDFPSAEQPVLCFLDTRGTEEGRYDPGEDIRQFNDTTHLMIVTVRVMDQSLAETVRWLREFRRAKPHRPVLLALTCLHEAYPGSQHPQPDPFVEPLDADQLPDPLRRVLEEHRRLFSGLVDRIVPIDLTRAEEGFRVADFGGDRLRRSVVDLLPAAYRQTFLNFGDATRNLKSLHERRAMPYVIGCSTLAATAAAVPTPWVDIPLVMAIQSHLVYRLHILYGRPIDRSALQRLVAATGVRLLSRLAVRETLKFIPFVGTAANAAVAYAYTFGLGKACCWYFGEVLSGNSPTVDDMKQVWKEQLRTAAGLWKVAPESSGRTLSEAAKGTSLLGERETQGGGG